MSSSVISIVRFQRTAIFLGHNQSIWFQVNLTTTPWQEELSDDESDLFQTTCQYISDKVRELLRKGLCLRHSWIMHVLVQTQTTTAYYRILPTLDHHI